MNRIAPLVRAVGTLLASTLLAAAGAASAAPSVAGLTFDTCGKWTVRLRDFGKFSMQHYNDFIPENLKVPVPPLVPPEPTYDTPRVRVEFGDGSGTGVDAICSAGTSCFQMEFYFTNALGIWYEVNSSGLPVMDANGVVPFTEVAFGSYQQKGRKMRMEFDSGLGDEGLRRMFSDTGDLALFGARDLVSIISGPLVEDPNGRIPCTLLSGQPGLCSGVPTLNKARMSARVSDSLDLKFKLKSKLTYDIDSDIADVNSARGKLRFKGKGERCPLPPPP